MHSKSKMKKSVKMAHDSVEKICIGTAAWTIPKEHKNNFAEIGTHLEKYSKIFNAVEINTSFYKDHKAITYERWAQSVPEHFRFSVKLSKVFTHEQRLKKGQKKLKENLRDILKLDSKLGCILVQLPPSLGFVNEDASKFFAEIRKYYPGPIAFEPRHADWQKDNVLALYEQYCISKVIADPPTTGSGVLHQPSGFIYFRLHGTPQIYKSNYENNRLVQYASQINKFVTQGQKVWCIFDNTTFGHATGNAISLTELIKNDNCFVSSIRNENQLTGF